MYDLLQRAASAVPDTTAVVSSESSMTYAQMHSAALGVSRGLRGEGLKRAVVVEPDATRLLVLLGGAAHAGVQLCLLQPDLDAEAVGAAAEQLGGTPVITRRSDLTALECLDPDRWSTSSPSEEAAAAEQPILIRTTGTTGEPKVARHDWQVLARTVASVRSRPEQRWLLAYGPQQFAGIQVILHVLATQATLVAPFPRQPRDGLEAIVEHGVTCVSATPTYWKFLLAEATGRGVELPALEQITLGGEASPAVLLDDLALRFPAARITHVYASTELGSVASVSDGRAGLSVDQLLSDANPDATLQVIDGQLWVRAGAGMLGYLDDDGKSDGDDPWRATGDMVEIVGDRVEFRGRSSEIINVGGVKVHPLPVEERIYAIDGVQAARVFGRPNALTGAIVAADIMAADGSDENLIRAAVREAVADLPRAWHPRSINFVEHIATLGDKTIRRMDT